MKTRIEVWVDVDIPEVYVDQLRQLVENAAWDGVNDFRVHNPGALTSVMVQANEIYEHRKY
jgi:hypothetical protein